MFAKLKNALLMLFCAALVLQLGGCIFVDRDHWRHHDRHDEGHDAGIDIRVHE